MGLGGVAALTHGERIEAWLVMVVVEVEREQPAQSTFYIYRKPDEWRIALFVCSWGVGQYGCEPSLWKMHPRVRPSIAILTGRSVQNAVQNTERSHRTKHRKHRRPTVRANVAIEHD